MSDNDNVNNDSVVNAKFNAFLNSDAMNNLSSDQKEAALALNTAAE